MVPRAAVLVAPFGDVELRVAVVARANGDASVFEAEVEVLVLLAAEGDLQRNYSKVSI